VANTLADPLKVYKAGKVAEWVYPHIPYANSTAQYLGKRLDHYTQAYTGSNTRLGKFLDYYTPRPPQSSSSQYPTSNKWDDTSSDSSDSDSPNTTAVVKYPGRTGGKHSSTTNYYISRPMYSGHWRFRNDTQRRKIYSRKHTRYAKNAYASAVRRRFRKGINRTGGTWRWSSRHALKFWDNVKWDGTALTIPDDGIIVPFMTLNYNGGGTGTGITRGTGPNQRIGNRIILRTIQFRGSITSSANSSGYTNHIRVLLVWDKQTNGSLASAGDVIASSDAATDTSNWTSYNNMDNIGRFKIIYDRLFRTTSQTLTIAGTASAPVTLNFNIYKKCYIPIEYDISGTNGTIDEVKSNSVFALFFSEWDDGATALFSVRLRYKDLNA